MINRLIDNLIHLLLDAVYEPPLDDPLDVFVLVLVINLRNSSLVNLSVDQFKAKYSTGILNFFPHPLFMRLIEALFP